MRTPGEQGLPPTLGPDICDWIEAECVYGAGDVQGDPVVLDEERRGVIGLMYELAPPDRCPGCGADHGVPAWDYPWTCPTCHEPLPARRAWKTVKLSKPKGWSKSGLAAFLAPAEALAEVRFDGWGADDEPRGRPVRNPRIRIAALSEDQAGETTFGPTAVVCEHLAANGWPVDIGRDPTSSTRINVTDAPGGGIGFIQLATMKAASSDGGQTTFAVTDEEHLWTAREAHALHATIRRNLKKRPDADPWLLGTTTMYRAGEQSVAELTDQAASGVGRSLVIHSQADDELDVWEDRDRQVVDRGRLALGLRQAYRDAFPWAVNLDDMVAEFQDPRSDPADSERYFLNRKTDHADSFIFEPEWAANVRDRPAGWQPDAGEHVVLGFDGSLTDDHTGLVGIHVPSATMFVAHHWQPDELGDDWQHEVKPAVLHAMKRWGVTRLYADPPHWRDEVAAWSRGNKGAKPFETASKRRMTPALKAFREAVKAGAFGHVNHPDLNRHVLNARLVRKAGRVDPDLNPDGEWWAIAKPTQTKHDPSNKIDLGVCAVLAWAAYLDTVAADEQPQRRRSGVLRYA